MRVFSIGMMSATKTKSKKMKESTLEIIHDGVVMAKLLQLSSVASKKPIVSTENKVVTVHSKKEVSEKQFYVVSDGVVFM